MIRALVFDFDGLILDTETPLIEAWAEVHARAGLVYERAAAVGLIGHVDVDFDPWTSFGPEADRAALDRMHEKLLREFVARQPILPGVVTCLDEARQLGLRLGIASNSSHRHVDGHLARLGLAKYFEVVRCRDDVKAGKPEPDLYTAAVNHLGVAPNEAVAFEDSQAGSIAAKRAGLWCIAVPSRLTREHDFSHTDLCVESLADQPLAELLQRFGT